MWHGPRVNCHSVTRIRLVSLPCSTCEPTLVQMWSLWVHTRRFRLTPNVGFDLMFAFKKPLAEKRLLKFRSRVTRTTSSTWLRTWVRNCGKVSVWLHRRRESKLPHGRLSHPTNRRPVSTPRDELDRGPSTTLQRAIYSPKQSRRTRIFR